MGMRIEHTGESSTVDAPKVTAKVEATVVVSMDRIADLICTGMEGGCIDMCMDYTYETAGITKEDLKAGKYGPLGIAWADYRHIWCAIIPGASIVFKDNETHEVIGKLNLETIKTGLPKFLSSRHAADFLDENEDAITGDYFIQMCALGEYVYG